MMALIALATTTTAFAEPTTISSKVLSHLSASFKNAKNISWTTDSRFEKISFMLNEEKVEAFYNIDGDLIGTSKTMAFDKLPKAAIETITTKFTFPDYQLKDCIQFTNSSNDTNYYISLDAKNETMVLEITKSGGVRVFSKTRK